MALQVPSFRVLAIRANRALAWAVLLSPLVQIVIGTRLVPGLLFDLGLLVAHGAASLWLFGLPRARRGDGWRLAVGLTPKDMGPRGRFLMTGWRIALPLLSVPAWPLGLPPGVWIALVPLWVHWLLMPVHVVIHIGMASATALRRWGWRDEDAITGAASAIVIGGMVANLANLLR